MQQELLIRLFRSIEGEPNEDIVKVAEKIIEEENKRGHTKLASKLKEILTKNIQSYSSFRGELKTILPKGVTIPTDKRYNIPLASTIERERLRHEMILPDHVEQKLLRIEKEYVARERLKHHGLKPKQKILLYGSPGCGKSMTAERIAWNIGLPFLKVRFEAIISSYLGESASNLKKLFEAIKNFQCVLLLDEFDFIAKARTQNGKDVGEMHRIVNILLNLLEDYEAPGILIATTNFEEIIDYALFRRFDEIIEMPKPSEKEIHRLLRQTLSGMQLRNITLEKFANQLKGFSSALVVKIANDAAKLAVIEGKGELNENHLEQAIIDNHIFNKN